MEIEEAIALIASNINNVEDIITLSLEDAYGHILAKDITADADIPSFSRSAMDGYAVKAEDTNGASEEGPVKLQVVDEVLAGETSSVVYEKGTAVRIMTGAMIPDGYDAVVMQENTDLGEDEVLIYSPASQYMNYCHAGEEIQKGSLVLPAGRRIGMIETGLIASCGLDKVPVRRPLKAAVISTGSELTAPGSDLLPGRIYGNIRFMLAAAIKSEGFEVTTSCDCPDDEETIRDQIIKAAAISDVVITTGGVSVGKRDLVSAVLSGMGARTLFTRVNVQPGTPTTASVYDGTVILSLSGNPYAALANFDLYFPALAAKFMGCPALDTVTCEAVLADPYEKVNVHRRLVRAYEENGKVFLPAKKHISSVFGNLDKCNCYMDIPADTKVAVGDSVKIRRMRYR